jgi:hypothetical protein
VGFGQLGANQPINRPTNQPIESNRQDMRLTAVTGVNSDLQAALAAEQGRMAAASERLVSQDQVWGAWVDGVAHLQPLRSCMLSAEGLR